MSLSEVTTARPATLTPPAPTTTPAPVAATRLERWLTPVELTLLGAIWGGSFLFMRVAASDFGPFALVEVRLALGATVLLPFLWRARTQFTPALWLHLTWISAINSAVPFILFAWGAERAPAGIGAITNSMAVMFAALVAFIFYGERIGPRRAIGLLAGFVGVVILASGKTAGTSVAPGSTRRHVGRISVRHRRERHPTTSERHSGRRGRRRNPDHREPVGITAGDLHVADPSDSLDVLGERDSVGRALYGHRLRHLLPPHSSYRRTEGRDGDLPGTAVWCHLGLDCVGRDANTVNGSVGRPHPGRSRAESAASRQGITAVARASQPRSNTCNRRKHGVGARLECKRK